MNLSESKIYNHIYSRLAFDGYTLADIVACPKAHVIIAQMVKQSKINLTMYETLREEIEKAKLKEKP